MNLRIITKNHAADPEIGFPTKSSSKPYRPRNGHAASVEVKFQKISYPSRRFLFGFEMFFGEVSESVSLLTAFPPIKHQEFWSTFTFGEFSVESKDFEVRLGNNFETFVSPRLFSFLKASLSFKLSERLKVGLTLFDFKNMKVTQNFIFFLFFKYFFYLRNENSFLNFPVFGSFPKTAVRKIFQVIEGNF